MRRFLLAVAMSAGLLVSVPALTAAASAETFVPVRLTVWDTEDWTGADEVSMRYLGNDWQMPLNNNQFGVPDAKTFSGSFGIEVLDLDLGNWMDPHDLIGTHTVSAEQKGRGEQSAHFFGHGAHYELRYRVED